MSERQCVVAPLEFTKAFRLLPSAVTIVTTCYRGLRFGMTATAVVPVSAEPAQILVAINSSARCCGSIAHAKSFAINFLTQADADLAKLFSKSGLDHAIRFSSGDWKTHVTGSPILTSSVASFDCTLADTHNHGTHSLFVGRVLSVNSKDQLPLIYRNGAYVLREEALGCG